MSNSRPIESHEYAIMLGRVQRQMELHSGASIPVTREDIRTMLGIIDELKDELKKSRDKIVQYESVAWGADEMIDKVEDAEYAAEHYGYSYLTKGGKR